MLEVASAQIGFEQAAHAQHTSSILEKRTYQKAVKSQRRKDILFQGQQDKDSDFQAS